MENKKAELTPLKKKIIELGEKYSALIKEVGSTVWEYAELSRQEYRSSAYLTKKLEEMGFTVERGVAGYPTSFVGVFTHGNNGLTIGLLCEYDALPGVFDESGEKNGHGCGHNLFAAGAFGTAAVLKELIETEDISATIKVFGTPSEEEHGSKPYFVKQGIFDGVDCFMGFHPLEFNGVLYSQHNAITTRDYKFYGKSAHAGAEPELGISALDAVEIMNVAVNYLREHVTSDVRIHYIITNGGERANIVPAFASSNYAIRAQELDNLKKVTDRIDTIAKGVAMAVGCRVEIEEGDTFANTILNRPLAELAYANMCMIGSPKFTPEEQEAVKAMGFENGLLEEIEPLKDYQGAYTASTDEGDVSWQGPWIRVCMSCLADNTPGHSYFVTKQANMSSAYKGTVQTVKVCASTIADILTKPEEMARVKEDYKKRMEGKEYKRDKNIYPNIKFFPDMPGAKLVQPDKLRINVKEAIILPNPQDKIINVYLQDKKIGSIDLENCIEEADIVLNERIKKGDVLLIKYQIKGIKKETLLGYLQHCIE